ncbi:MAG: electron transport complex subunit RsxG [Endozoicomonas sp. (ex Botrylloides leachii)]|nr:electron transport complex subunit RsxG [Endozoicomonas sp. (ex Botrylloides leachii)]
MSKNTETTPTTAIRQLLTIISKNSVNLGLFSILTVGLISLTYVLTESRINQQMRDFEARALKEVVPNHMHDNILLDTTISLPPSKLLSTQKVRTGYVACKKGKPVAVILPTIAPDGYSGRIDLLVGIKADGTLTGVRVVSEKETPGLGDKIETSVSNWIFSFTGKSIGNPDPKGWAVKKDGGIFDQFTGATITPRAVVGAIYRSLEYFRENKNTLLNKNQIKQIHHND